MKKTTRKKVVKNQTKTKTMRLEENMDISIVNIWKSKLLSTLDKKQTVVLDAGKVERIDGAMLQLLCAYCLSAKDKDIKIKWKNVSDKVKYSIQVLGLDKIICI